MSEDRFRSLLRKIALGLPLVAGPLVLSGCWCTTGDCGPPERETMIVTEAPDGGTDCYAACPPQLESGKYLFACAPLEAGAGFACNYEWGCIGGRRPDDPLAAFVKGPDDPRTRALLELAAAEAASVPAFRALAVALAHHGAPPELVRRASESAEDEVRHTQLALRLAGQGAVRVHVGANTLPSLEELAISNAKEGCVREAYGALEAAHQAMHAGDPEARAVFASIARDEARHALLSQDIDAWLRGRVDPARVDAARDEALRELRAGFASRERAPGLGLPDARASEALLALVA